MNSLPNEVLDSPLWIAHNEEPYKEQDVTLRELFSKKTFTTLYAIEGNGFFVSNPRGNLYLIEKVGEDSTETIEIRMVGKKAVVFRFNGSGTSYKGILQGLDEMFDIQFPYDKELDDEISKEICPQ